MSLLGIKLRGSREVGAGKAYNGKLKTRDKLRGLPRGPIDRWEESMMAKVLGGQNQDDDLQMGGVMRWRKNILDEYNGNEDDSVFNQGGQKMFRFQPVITPKVDRRGKPRWEESNLVENGGIGGGMYPGDKSKKIKSYPKLTLDEEKIEDRDYDYLNERESKKKNMGHVPKQLKVPVNEFDDKYNKDQNQVDRNSRDRRGKVNNDNFQIRSNRQVGKNIESPLQKENGLNERKDSPIAIEGQIRRKYKLEHIQERNKVFAQGQPNEILKNDNFPKFQQNDLKPPGAQQSRLLDVVIMKNKAPDQEPNANVGRISKKSKFSARGDQIGIRQSLGNMNAKQNDIKVAPHGNIIHNQADQQNQNRENKFGRLGQSIFNSDNQGRLAQNNDQLRRVQRDAYDPERGLSKKENQINFGKDQFRQEQQIRDFGNKHENKQDFERRIDTQDQNMRNINEGRNLEGNYRNQGMIETLKERKKKGI